MNELADFFISFTTQGMSELKTSMGEINDRLDELQDGFGKASKKSKEADTGLETMSKRVMGLVAGFFSLQKIMSGVFSTNADIMALNNMASYAGIAAEKIETLSIATQKFGGTKESAGAVFGNLSNMMTKVSQGLISDDQRIAMARYGVSFMGKKGLATPEEMLENMAKVMPRLTAGQRADLGNAMGIDKPTIQLLSKGLNELRKELARATQKTVLSNAMTEKENQQFNDNLNELKRAWSDMVVQFTPIVNALMGIATGIMKGVSWFWERVQAGVDVIDIGINKITGGAFGSTKEEILETARWKKHMQDAGADETMSAAKSTLAMTKTPLNSSAPGRGGLSKNEQVISIGSIVIEDKSGEIKGKTGALKSELNDMLRSLELSPALLSKSMK